MDYKKYIPQLQEAIELCQSSINGADNDIANLENKKDMLEKELKKELQEKGVSDIKLDIYNIESEIADNEYYIREQEAQIARLKELMERIEKQEPVDEDDIIASIKFATEY